MASPIIDNKVYSLPIPADETQIFNPKYSKKYKDLKFGNLSGSEIFMDGNHPKVDQWARYLIKTHGTRIKRKSTLRDAFLSETS